MRLTTLKLTMAALGVLLAVNARAYDVKIDGIYYTLKTSTKTATLTYESTSYNSYSGKVVIPSSISSGGTSHSGKIYETNTIKIY